MVNHTKEIEKTYTFNGNDEWKLYIDFEKKELKKIDLINEKFKELHYRHDSLHNSELFILLDENNNDLNCSKKIIKQLEKDKFEVQIAQIDNKIQILFKKPSGYRKKVTAILFGGVVAAAGLTAAVTAPLWAPATGIIAIGFAGCTAAGAGVKAVIYGINTTETNFSYEDCAEKVCIGAVGGAAGGVVMAGGAIAAPFVAASALGAAAVPLLGVAAQAGAGVATEVAEKIVSGDELTGKDILKGAASGALGAGVGFSASKILSTPALGKIAEKTIQAGISRGAFAGGVQAAATCMSRNKMDGRDLESNLGPAMLMGAGFGAINGAVNAKLENIRIQRTQLEQKAFDKLTEPKLIDGKHKSPIAGEKRLDLMKFLKRLDDSTLTMLIENAAPVEQLPVYFQAKNGTLDERALQIEGNSQQNISTNPVEQLERREMNLIQKEAAHLQQTEAEWGASLKAYIKKGYKLSLESHPKKSINYEEAIKAIDHGLGVNAVKVRKHHGSTTSVNIDGSVTNQNFHKGLATEWINLRRDSLHIVRNTIESFVSERLASDGGFTAESLQRLQEYVADAKRISYEITDKTFGPNIKELLDSKGKFYLPNGERLREPLQIINAFDKSSEVQIECHHQNISYRNPNADFHQELDNIIKMAETTPSLQNSYLGNQTAKPLEIQNELSLPSTTTTTSSIQNIMDPMNPSMDMTQILVALSRTQKRNDMPHTIPPYVQIQHDLDHQTRELSDDQDMLPSSFTASTTSRDQNLSRQSIDVSPYVQIQHDPEYQTTELSDDQDMLPSSFTTTTTSRDQNIPLIIHTISTTPRMQNVGNHLTGAIGSQEKQKKIEKTQKHLGRLKFQRDHTNKSWKKSSLSTQIKTYEERLDVLKLNKQ